MSHKEMLLTWLRTASDPVKYPCSMCANRSERELSLVKNAGYGSIKNVTLHLSSKITLQVFVNHVKTNCITI